MPTDTPAGLLRTFLPTALGLLGLGTACGIAAALTGEDDLLWAALHLLMLGGVSQLIVGVGQFVVCAFLATAPPPRRLVVAQVVTWNAAVLLVVLSLPLELPRLADLGSLVTLVGLGLFAWGLQSMRRRSLQSQPWALRWYNAAALLLAAGAIVGAALAGAVAWRHGSLLGAHISFNVVGWLGTAIVGTLHTFFPTLTGTRLRFPRLQAWTFGAWILGTLLLADGMARGSGSVKALGLAALSLAAGLLASNLLASLRARTMPLSRAAVAVAAGQCALVVALVSALLAPLVMQDAGILEGAALTCALIPTAVWIVLTVAGSLVHLLGVLAHVQRIRRGDPRFG